MESRSSVLSGHRRHGTDANRWSPEGPWEREDARAAPTEFLPRPAGVVPCIPAGRGVARAGGVGPLAGPGHGRDRGHGGCPRPPRADLDHRWLTPCAFRRDLHRPGVVRGPPDHRPVVRGSRAEPACPQGPRVEARQPDAPRRHLRGPSSAPHRSWVRSLRAPAEGLAAGLSCTVAVASVLAYTFGRRRLRAVLWGQRRLPNA